MAGCEVVIVGGGFAGVVAARELSRTGREVVLLEGRDRLGGRTWSKADALPGRTLELGGAWVHWFQAHVWAEITRYGLDVEESLGSSAAEEVLFVSGGERLTAPLAELWPGLEQANEWFTFDAAEVFPRPHEPLANAEGVASLDGQSVQDRLDKITVTPEQRDLLNALWSACCSAPCRDAGLVAMLRWYALAGGNLGLMFDAAARYKLRQGTGALVDAIAGDATGAEIRLATPVEAITHDTGGVSVTTRDGERIDAKVAVVTAPLNTLGSIRFTPGLAAAKETAAREGHAGRGAKLWVEVRGDLPHPVFALAPDDHPLQYLHTEELLSGGQVLVGLGCDAAALDVSSPEAVTPAVRALLGDVEVVAATGHDWLADEFSRGTWSVFRPHQTSALPGLQAPEGRVVFAGSELANGWSGFIDGAIESGLRAARQAGTVLG